MCIVLLLTRINIARETFFINSEFASRTVVDDFSGYNVTEVFAKCVAIFIVADGDLRS